MIHAGPGARRQAEVGEKGVNLGRKHRTGLFGGSFDPPTIAHFIVAQWAVEQLDLDELWLIPAALNPLKSETPPTDPKVRTGMLRAGLGDNPSISIKTLELDREGPSYTVDTVEELKRQHPERSFVLILGMDSLASLPRWKRVDDLLELVDLAVASRPGTDMRTIPESVWERVELVDIPEMDISSTLVRERIAQGKTIRHLVPGEVEALIRKHRLYHR